MHYNQIHSNLIILYTFIFNLTYFKLIELVPWVHCHFHTSALNAIPGSVF